MNADKQFDFAETYFSKREYFKAIIEYERFIYFFPEDERFKTAMYQIGIAYFESKRFNEAITAFNDIIARYGDVNISIDDVAKAYFMISECYIRQELFGPAISNLQYLLTLTDNKDIIDKVHYRIGWIYIEIGEWENARLYFGKIDSENREAFGLTRLLPELDKEVSIPKKNPILAGLFSVIPGGGFLYCERYYDAATAFLLNGILMYAAYESFDNEMYALGSLITLVELGFYTGSIYGGIASAHKYNKAQHRSFIDKLKKNINISLSPVYKDNGIFISFQFSFN